MTMIIYVMMCSVCGYHKSSQLGYFYPSDSCIFSFNFARLDPSHSEHSKSAEVFLNNILFWSARLLRFAIQSGFRFINPNHWLAVLRTWNAYVQATMSSFVLCCVRENLSHANILLTSGTGFLYTNSCKHVYKKTVQTHTFLHNVTHVDKLVHSALSVLFPLIYVVIFWLFRFFIYVNKNYC